MQPVRSPDIVLVGFEPESVRFQILVLLNWLGVTPVTSGTEPTGLPECCRVEVSLVRFRWYTEYRLLKPIVEADY